jgi:hypothetical protein
MENIMTDTKYNGWTNYATWRVNLEVFDGLDKNEVFDLSLDDWALRHVLQDYAEEVIFSEHRYDERAPSSLIEDYARAFLAEVDWYEIAKHMIAEHAEEQV